MKRFALVAATMLLCGTAFAQPPQFPQEIESDGVISLGMGQSKAFEFRDPIGEIYFSPEDVVKARPQSDKQFAISPTAPGSTRMFVRSSAGVLLYNVDIVVAPEPGHLVKTYGDSKNADLNAGYTATYCTETGCERPDKDLPKPALRLV
jgi:Flp pilus assembly secretin CpaC